MWIGAEPDANSSGWDRCRCLFQSFWNEDHRESFPGAQPLMRRLWCLSRVHIINTPSVPSLIRIQLRHLHRGDAAVGLRLKSTSAKMFFSNWTSPLLLVSGKSAAKQQFTLDSLQKEKVKELSYFQAWFSGSCSHCNRGALKAKWPSEMIRD